MHIRGMINEISHSKGAAVPFAFLIGHGAVGIGALNALPLGSCVCMEESTTRKAPRRSLEKFWQSHFLLCPRTILWLIMQRFCGHRRFAEFVKQQAETSRPWANCVLCLPKATLNKWFPPLKGSAVVGPRSVCPCLMWILMSRQADYSNRKQHFLQR